MAERGTTLLSSTGVSMAVLGTISHVDVLSFLGTLLTLCVHLWTTGRDRSGAKKEQAELRYWKSHARHLAYRLDELRTELARLKAAQSVPGEYPHSPDVTPPFEPGGAAVDV
jgi:hypothetical protein